MQHTSLMIDAQTQTLTPRPLSELTPHSLLGRTGKIYRLNSLANSVISFISDVSTNNENTLPHLICRFVTPDRCHISHSRNGEVSHCHTTHMRSEV